MPKFKYAAIKDDGKKINGTYDVNTEEEVIAMLRSNGYYTISVELIKGSKEIKKFSFNKVSSKDISVFARQFYTMLNVGISILTILDILSKQTINKKFKKVIIDIHENLQKGLTFSESVSKHEKIFPKLFINMMVVGENSGNLDIMMEKMANHYEKENKINNKIKNAMIYPIILSIVSIIVVMFLLIVVMPTFISMFESNGAPLPIPTKILLKISYIIKDFGYIFLGVILVSVYLLKKYKDTDKGRYTIDKFKLKIPVLNNILKIVMTSRFTRTLSMLQSSGISLISSLDLIENILGNKVGSNLLRETKEQIRKGKSLGKVMEGTSLFPPMLTTMIKIGEESGALDDVLNKTADFYDEELESVIRKFTSLLEPIMIIIMAIVIGGIVIAMVLPMFDMINIISF
ncbi:type II secretion system F family protein [Clostridium sp. D2Q-14]|uniref:type II secretion system F family protein n=1 Tax=Anaeromonas gelatinilytica TaxID=2683194 RepID=UPI00193B9AEA|nr:type II secretion system F family protein [Anaeromonas gelatinilytica]MBS4536184.1 type II secretion system F family protein [Anaeromonas gelatinilytica]